MIPRRRAAQVRGRQAEDEAVQWLRAAGYEILARGFAPGRGLGAGEIDIIALKDGVVAFVEVKQRASLTEAAQSISAAQRRRIARSATAFMARRPDLDPCGWRFDAILMGADGLPEHLPDAWRPDE